MKKYISFFCICIALAIFMSSLFGALLPVEHCCGHKGCPVCLLISFIERLLFSILLVATLVFARAFLPVYCRPVKGFPSDPRPLSNTPVDRMDKLSN